MFTTISKHLPFNWQGQHDITKRTFANDCMGEARIAIVVQATVTMTLRMIPILATKVQTREMITIITLKNVNLKSRKRVT